MCEPLPAVTDGPGSSAIQQQATSAAANAEAPIDPKALKMTEEASLSSGARSLCRADASGGTWFLIDD